MTAHQIHSGRTGSRRSLRRSSRDRPPAVMWLEPPPDEPAREGRRSYGVVWCPTLSMLLSRRFDFVGMWRSGMWVACSAKSASEGRWASRGPGHPGAMLTAPAATYLRRTDHVLTNPHLFLANQNRVNHPTRRSTSDTEAIALPERPARGKRYFQDQVPGSIRIDVRRLWSGTRVSGHRGPAAWWPWWWCGRTRAV